MSDRVDRRDALRRLGAIVAGGAAALTAARRGRPQAASRPNIILIMADDLGYGDLGCYGQTEILTPNLDAMAAAGVRFTDCYSGSPVCRPSRCSLLTGLHTGHTHIRRNEPVPLGPGDYTVAQMLKDVGYATGVIGKWGLGGPGTNGTPLLMGFDYFLGHLLNAQEYYPSELWQNDRPITIEGNLNGGQEVYAPDLFTSQALSFIRRTAHQPFLLYLAQSMPHASTQAYRRTGNGMEVPSDAPYTDRPWPQTEKNYAAMITRLDGYVGRLLATLKAEGIADRTLVLFSSDNGPHDQGGHDPSFFDDNGPLRGIKGSLYDGGIRVPMVAYWPGTVPAGVVSEQPWAFWDFMPTAAELAGVATPPGLDGVSVAPVLLGQPPFDRPYLYWESYETAAGRQQAVRLRFWKGVRPSPTSPIELYDLSQDIGETTDVAAANPGVVAQIDAAMLAGHGGVPPRLVWSRRPGYVEDGVEPDSGSANATSFRFEVRVGDLDGGQPDWVRLAIERDGEDWQTGDLTPGNSVNRWGRNYFHVRKLPQGNFRYQFTAGDVDGADRLPGLGFAIGPIVETYPYVTWTGEPGFVEDGVEPNGGEADSTLFEFRVLYRAHDGDLPDYVRLMLWRDGARYRTCQMKPSPLTTDPVEGLIYYIRRLLPAGAYEYRFLAADRHGRARGVASRQTGGLTVLGVAPALSGLTASPTPNGGAQITFALSAPADVSVEVANIAGRPIAAITRGTRLRKGVQTLLWHGRSDTGLPAPNGTYVVRVTSRGADGSVSRSLTTCSIRR
ncbi:MAG: sulfatase-like hydrolase/transferase [Gemmatimonadetes bacterium]|nr:sulfatase-like hydrolase/transferase [Gemmatimonadota bacterium]